MRLFLPFHTTSVYLFLGGIRICAQFLTIRQDYPWCRCKGWRRKKEQGILNRLYQIKRRDALSSKTKRGKKRKAVPKFFGSPPNNR